MHLTRRTFSAAAILQIIALTFAAGLSFAAAARPGSVDTTFDAGRGPQSVEAGQGLGVVLQPDGRSIVGGAFNGLGLREVPPLVRLHTDGLLDETFDASQLKQRFPTAAGITPFAVQSDGKVLAGPLFGPDGPETVVRLNADGTLDSSFNPQLAGDNGQTRVRRAVVQPDGRILISGGFHTVNGVARQHLARLHPDGSTDLTFSAARSGDFQLLRNGQLIVRSGTLYRLHNDGSLDSTFSADVPPADPGYGYIGSYLIQADGKIVYTQRLNVFGSDVVRRLNADGSEDSGFKVAYGQFVFLSLIQTDGKIEAGSLRLHPDGTPDESFRAEGLEFSAMAEQADAKLIAAGNFYSAPSGIRRVLSDGSIDPAFTVEGGGLTKIARKKIEGAALLPDGRVAVGGGFEYFDGVRRRGLAVLNADGTVDATFDPADLIRLEPYSVTIRGLAAQPDGKLLVTQTDGLMRLNLDGSRDSSFNPFDRLFGATVVGEGKILTHTSGRLVRVLSDGSLDPAFNSAFPEARLLFVDARGRVIVSTASRTAARLHPDGSLDSGFSGFGGSPMFDRVHAVAQEADGRYIVSRSDLNSRADLLFRASDDGSRDPTLNSDVTSASHIVADAAGITIAGDVGQRRSSPPPPNVFGVTRLNFDGSRDTSFAPAVFDTRASATQLIRQPDGNLIVTGEFAEVNGVPRRGIARLIGNSPRHLANISTRVHVGGGEEAAIGGFIIVGDEPKRVIVRALGPSLASSGLPGSELVSDPALEVVDASGAVLARNDNWRESQAEVSATGLAPGEDTESAIVATLLPGAYTAVMRDVTGGGGVALVEIYDLDFATGSTLGNISTRGVVGGGENVMIGGFILRGSESSTVVARAIGPSLSAAGVLDVVADPSLVVYNASGEAVAANDNWKTSQQAALEALGMGAAHDDEAALLVTLPPGAYTAVVSGEGGVGLVEIYDVR